MCTLACLQLKYIILERYKGHIILLKFTQHFPEGPFIWPDLQQSTYAFRVSIKGENFLPHSSTGRIKSACYTSADTHKTVKWYFSSPVINIYGLTNCTDTPNCPRIAILGTLSGTIVSSSFFSSFLDQNRFIVLSGPFPLPETVREELIYSQGFLIGICHKKL